MTARTRRTTRVLAVLALALPMIAVAAPASAQDDLISATPTTVTIETPGPGHAETWTMTVTNVSTVDVPLSLRITGEDVPLFSGPTPLEVTVRDAGGTTVVGPLAAGELVDELITLPTLPAGSSYALSGSAMLPRAADNSYQGMSGELLFRFVATDPRTPLAQTGSSVPALAVMLSFIGVGIGVLLLTRRKVRDDA